MHWAEKSTAVCVGYVVLVFFASAIRLIFFVTFCIKAKVKPTKLVAKKDSKYLKITKCPIINSNMPNVDKSLRFVNVFLCHNVAITFKTQSALKNNTIMGMTKAQANSC